MVSEFFIISFIFFFHLVLHLFDGFQNFFYFLFFCFLLFKLR